MELHLAIKFHMRSIICAGLILAASASSAWAQCSGVFPANTVCGNNTGSPAVPTAVSFGGAISGPGSSTNNGLPLWANTIGTALKDGAGQTIAGNYTWGGTQNFTSTFQVNGNAMTFPGVAATIPGAGTSNTFSGTNNFTSTFQVGGNTMTFPGSTATLAALNLTGQTLSGGANVTSASLGTFSTGTQTVNCGTGPLQFFTNNGAFTLASPANDGSCDLLQTNGASAGAITFSGFTVGANTGDALTTTNTNKFILHIERINAIATYVIKALQ